MAEPSRCTRRRSSVVFAYWRHRPGASERGSFAGERRQRNAPANVADEPRAGPQRGGVSPPNSSGTPDKGPLAGTAERIGSRRFANGSAVHRQTRRMEPPGCTRSEQSDVCESGGSSATFALSMNQDQIPFITVRRRERIAVGVLSLPMAPRCALLAYASLLTLLNIPS